MGFILMYDVTNEDSFKCVQDWVTQIKTYSWDNAQVVLVGTCFRAYCVHRPLPSGELSSDMECLGPVPALP